MYTPVNTRSSRIVSKFHSFSLESSLAVTNRASSGLQLRPRTASLWAFHAATLFIFGWKYFTMPLSSDDKRKLPQWLYRRARIVLSWACRMVSKLKVSPFQSVNSPLADAVRIRRASGVHYITVSLSGRTCGSIGILTVTRFTGYLILFVEVWTNLVHRDVDGLSR